MADLVLSDILAMASRNETKETLETFLRRPELPITDWESGGVFRTFLELETEVLDDLIAVTIPLVLGEGFVETSDGDWLAGLAHGIYGLDKVLATISTQTITLACSAAGGPHLIVAGTHVFRATDGRRYIAATGGTLSTSGTLQFDVKAESPGAAGGLVNALVTGLTGVTVIDAFIKIVSTVPQYGSNDEPDPTLIARCLDRWPSLIEVGTVDRVERWARAASTEVTRIRLDADPVNPGGVLVTIAGVSGAVSGGAVTAVQAYIDARSPITDYTIAQNASNLTITADATVTVPIALLTEIQTAANLAWIAYLSSAQIGSKVYRAKLVEILQDAGAIDVDVAGVLLNTVAADVSLSSNQAPVPDGTGLATLLDWVPV